MNLSLSDLIDNCLTRVRPETLRGTIYYSQTAVCMGPLRGVIAG